MKRHFFGAVGALAVVALLAGCKSDPTASLRGGVDRVVISRTYIEMAVGQTVRINAKSYDEQGNVLPDLPEVSVSDASVATVTIDTLTSGDPQPQTDFLVEAIAPGSVEITATAGGVSSDPTEVISFPLEFNGTISIAPYQGNNLDLLTIAGTSVLTFDAGTTVDIDGVAGYIVSQTATELQVLALNAGGTTDAVVTINDLLFLGSIVTTLDAADPVSTRPAYLSTESDGGGVLTDLGYPVTLNAVVSSENDGLFAYVSAGATDLTITATLSWDTDSDIDIYWTDETWSDYVGNFDGATLSNPEVSQVTIPAGTTWLIWLEHFGPADEDIVTLQITSP